MSAIVEFVFANLVENRQTSLFFWNLARNPGEKLSKIRRKMQNSTKKFQENEKNRKFNFSIAKTIWRFFTTKLRLENGFPRFSGFDSKTVQRSALCRSRRELSSFSNRQLIPTSIYLQKSASIQPRTSPSKFGGKYSILFTGVLSAASFGRTGCAATVHAKPS